LNPTSHSDPGSDTGSTRYSFSSQWHLDGSQEHVWSVFEELLETENPFIWWPGMHSSRQGGSDIHVVADSPVGYKLRFRLHDMVQTPIERVELQSSGELAGRATMVLAAVDEEHSTIDVSWYVDVTKPWMRAAGRVLRPVFVLAHDAVMAAGERGLNAWLVRDSDPVG
jgi:hypothetical protein